MEQANRDSASQGVWRTLTDFRRCSKGVYAEFEADARAHRRGLWAGEFEQLGLWRKGY
jgi:endonuclease YncB( thermonuclease family)